MHVQTMRIKYQMKDNFNSYAIPIYIEKDMSKTNMTFSDEFGHDTCRVTVHLLHIITFVSAIRP